MQQQLAPCPNTTGPAIHTPSRYCISRFTSVHVSMSTYHCWPLCSALLLSCCCPCLHNTCCTPLRFTLLTASNAKEQLLLSLVTTGAQLLSLVTARQQLVSLVIARQQLVSLVTVFNDSDLIRHRDERRLPGERPLFVVDVRHVLTSLRHQMSR